MRTTATELMKKLKYIEQEIADIHRSDEQEAYVPVERSMEDHQVKYVPAYQPTYDFLGNRDKIAELYKEEISIKKVLSDFNQKTIVSGYPFNINDALIRLGQLKSEVKALTNLNKTGLFTRETYREGLRMATFKPDEVKEQLRKAQKELSALQVAVDRTNLFSEIEYQD